MPLGDSLSSYFIYITLCYTSYLIEQVLYIFPTRNQSDHINDDIDINIWLLFQRVKVYRLTDGGKWDDQGTGHVNIDFIEVLYGVDKDGYTIYFY